MSFFFVHEAHVPCAVDFRRSDGKWVLADLILVVHESPENPREKSHALVRIPTRHGFGEFSRHLRVKLPVSGRFAQPGWFSKCRTPGRDLVLDAWIGDTFMVRPPFFERRRGGRVVPWVPAVVRRRDGDDSQVQVEFEWRGEFFQAWVHLGDRSEVRPVPPFLEDLLPLAWEGFLHDGDAESDEMPWLHEITRLVDEFRGADEWMDARFHRVHVKWGSSRGDHREHHDLPRVFCLNDASLHFTHIARSRFPHLPNHHRVVFMHEFAEGRRDLTVAVPRDAEQTDEFSVSEWSSQGVSLQLRMLGDVGPCCYNLAPKRSYASLLPRKDADREVHDWVQHIRLHDSNEAFRYERYGGWHPLYESQLQIMKSMGYDDREANIWVLDECHGDLQRALDLLMLHQQFF